MFNLNNKQFVTYNNIEDNHHFKKQLSPLATRSKCSNVQANDQALRDSAMMQNKHLTSHCHFMNWL